MKSGKSKSLNQQLRRVAKQAKGAGATEHARKLHVIRLGNYLKANNIQIKDISQIKAKYIQSYIAHRLEQGVKKRTLKNEMASIRKILRMENRHKLAGSPLISNKALGLTGDSRKGTKVAITDTQYQGVYQKAFQKSPALAATIEIARVLGLRGEEAVQSCQSLKTWQTALANGATKLKVVFGTKGGRPRETTVLDRTKVINAVNNALAIAEQHNGKLINKPTLKQSMTYWRNHCSSIGLMGKLAPHSLRYVFAQDLMRYYKAKGHSKKEVMAMVSMDLGHGDGRGRYIKLVYGNTGEEK